MSIAEEPMEDVAHYDKKGSVRPGGLGKADQFDGSALGTQHKGSADSRTAEPRSALLTRR